MEKAIYFDMDGTLVDFYNVDNWLSDLINSNPRPYAIAKPRINCKVFSETIKQLQKIGYKIGIISWLSKCSSMAFSQETTVVKKNWLMTHFPEIEFDEINIIEYGEPKSFYGEGILFDDEERNRKEWKGLAYDVNNIIEILQNLY